METIEYRQLAVAFIDIIGFGDLVKKSDTCEAALKRVQDALDALEKAKHQIDAQLKECASIQPALNGMERITVFSDSIILSGPNIGSVLIRAFAIAHQLLAADFLCRGAVVLGNACHTDTRIVGPASSMRMSANPSLRTTRGLSWRANWLKTLSIGPLLPCTSPCSPVC